MAGAPRTLHRRAAPRAGLPPSSRRPLFAVRVRHSAPSPVAPPGLIVTHAASRHSSTRHGVPALLHPQPRDTADNSGIEDDSGSAPPPPSRGQSTADFRSASRQSPAACLRCARPASSVSPATHDWARVSQHAIEAWKVRTSGLPGSGETGSAPTDTYVDRTRRARALLRHLRNVLGEVKGMTTDIAETRFRAAHAAAGPQRRAPRTRVRQAPRSRQPAPPPLLPFDQAVENAANAVPRRQRRHWAAHHRSSTRWSTA